MINLPRNISKIFRTPVWVVFIICIGLLLLNLIFVHLNRPYNSDDVSWQTALLTWVPFGDDRVYLAGSDTFFLKIPVFMFFASFFEPSRKLLFAESAFFAVSTFTLYYFSALYFLRKLKIKLSYQNLLPFIWFASFGYAMGQLYLNPILRNFEIGLSFVYFVIAAKVFYNEVDLSRWSSRFIGFGLTVLSGALIYNDPYFLYFTLIPIVCFYSIFWFYKKIDKIQLWSVALFTLGSFIFAKIAELFAVSLNATAAFSHPVEFVEFDKLFSNISLAIHSILILFGADFFGAKVISLDAIVALFNLVVVLIIVGTSYIILSKVRPLKSATNNPSQLWVLFFSVIIVFALLAYTVSSLAVDIQTYRYLVIVAFSAVLLLSFIVGMEQKRKKYIVAIIILAIAGNVIFMFKPQVSTQAGATGNTKNSANYMIIEAVKNNNLSKGYAPYWHSNINTYLSNGAAQFLPVMCSNNKTIYMNYLVNASQYKSDASRSFYIIDPKLSFPPMCSKNAIVEQFGKPVKVVPVNDMEILIFDYDIGTKM